MSLTMISAIGKNNELGKSNDLIWRFKEDLNFFKENTMGKPMVMGYNTFMSLRGGKPLPGRTHIVLSGRHLNEIEDHYSIIKIGSYEELLDFILPLQDEVMIIGGATIYNKLIEYANKLLITKIDDECIDADVFFPPIDESLYIKRELGNYIENDISYKRLEYIKKQ